MGWGGGSNRNAERREEMKGLGLLRYFSHVIVHNYANTVLTWVRDAERISEKGQTIRTKETVGFHS